MQGPNCHSEKKEDLRLCTYCAKPLNVAGGGEGGGPGRPPYSKTKK